MGHGWLRVIVVLIMKWSVYIDYFS